MSVRRVVYFMGVQKKRILSLVSISDREESLKLNLWKLLYRKTTKLSLTLLYKVELWDRK